MNVPHVLTPIRVGDLCGLLDAAYHGAVGTCPGLDVLAVLWAQVVEEHGRHKGETEEELAGVWCWNLGNHDATAGERSDPSVPIFATVPECEGVSCSGRYVHHRRAYATAEDGARAYMDALRLGFPGAFVALPDGPVAFAKALKGERYYTASETAYARALSSLANECRRVWIPRWQSGSARDD